MSKLNGVEVGFQVYLAEGGEEFGAVRGVSRTGHGELVIYVENGGDHVVTADVVHAVHDGKVILDGKKIDASLRRAIANAHAREEPGA